MPIKSDILQNPLLVRQYFHYRLSDVSTCNGLCVVFLITDASLTVDNIVGVLKLMKNGWYNKMAHILTMPVSKKISIEEQYSSKEDRLREFVVYIHSFHPSMSWGLLAGILYSMEEHEALKELLARKYLKFRKGWPINN